MGLVILLVFPFVRKKAVLYFIRFPNGCGGLSGFVFSTPSIIGL